MRGIGSQNSARFYGISLAAIILVGCEMPTGTRIGSKSEPGTPVASASSPASPSSANSPPNGGSSTKVFYPPGGGDEATSSSPASGDSPGTTKPGTATGHEVTGPQRVTGPPEVTGPISGGVGPPSGFSPKEPPKGGNVTTTHISLRLSAGVALAQTLPGGTGMLFSVDYRFSRRSNDQSMKYFWVIVPAKGRPITREVKLSDSGTLQAIVPGMQPEIGPFQCRIEVKPPADSRANDVTGLTRMVSENVPR